MGWQEEDTRAARHRRSVSKEETLEMWRKLIVGEIDALLAEPWSPGFG
jgi:hypothetical protein